MTATLLSRIGRLVTGTERGVLERVNLLVRDGRIAWVGVGSDEPPATLRTDIDSVVDAEGALVTAGLVDAHTHPVYAGSRFVEVAARTAGLSYTDLGADGGIGATVRATRATSREELDRRVRGRLARMLAQGTTTVEAKTGYHLEREGEIGDVASLRRLEAEGQMPRVHVTFLAAHAVPDDAEGADAYVEAAAGWADAAAEAGADAVDVFCDVGYFDVEQSRRVLVAGRDAGLQLRVHADELARSGGAKLAAEIGAASADHLLHVTSADAVALGRAGVAATLCPSTALSIGRTPDVAALREAGVVLALGSDHNPGTSGITSMSLVVALAVWALGLSVEEALRAATVGGAASLRRTDIGVVEEGAHADLVAWDADHEGAFAWAWGLDPRWVLRGGSLVGGDTPRNSDIT